jgi:hypothetical protein
VTDDSFIEKDPAWDDAGWTRVPNTIARDEGLSLEAKGLMLYLASHSSSFRVRLSTIERDCSVGRERLRRILKELSDAGFLSREITWQRIDGMNRRGPSRYTLHCFRRSTEVTGSEAVETEAVGIEALESEALENPSNLKKTTSKKTKVKKTTPEEDHRASEPLFAVAVVPQLSFADFWSIYPRKVSKAAAEKAWKSALKRSTPEEICAGAGRYAAAVQDWTGSERSFIKHASTWLNQDCWEDEEQPVRSNGRPSKNERDQQMLADASTEGTDPWALLERQDSPKTRSRLSLR